MKKGDQVIIAPARIRAQRWRGVIERKAGRGFSVRYEAFDVKAREAFSESELEIVK